MHESRRMLRALDRNRSQLFFSSFENYKRLKKKVAGPIPDVERYFLKEPRNYSA